MGFWFKWVLASAIIGLGPIAGMLLAWVIGLASPDRTGVNVQVEAFWGFVLVLLITWTLVGLVGASAQWVVLSSFLSSLRYDAWVRTITIGYLIVGLLYAGGWIVVNAGVYLYAGYLYFAIDGKTTGQQEISDAFTITSIVLSAIGIGASTVLGLVQRIALREHVPNAMRLIASNAGVALLFQSAALAIGYAIAGETTITGGDLWNTVLLGWHATLLLSGTATGITLVRLLRRSTEGQPKTPNS